MKLLILILALCSSGCLVSTIRTTDQHMDPACTFPTRKGSTDQTFLRDCKDLQQP